MARSTLATDSLNTWARRLLPAEVVAEIHALHVRIVSENFGRAGSEDSAVIDDVGALGDCQRCGQ